MWPKICLSEKIAIEFSIFCFVLSSGVVIQLFPRVHCHWRVRMLLFEHQEHGVSFVHCCQVHGYSILLVPISTKFSICFLFVLSYGSRAASTNKWLHLTSLAVCMYVLVFLISWKKSCYVEVNLTDLFWVSPSFLTNFPTYSSLKCEAPLPSPLPRHWKVEIGFCGPYERKGWVRLILSRVDSGLYWRRIE